MKPIRMGTLLVLLSVTGMSTAELVLAQPFEAYLDRGLQVVVWKDPAAMEQGLATAEEGTPGDARLIACVVPSGTKARLDRIGASPAWKVTVLEGASRGCQGVVGGNDFKTAGEREKRTRRAATPPPAAEGTKAAPAPGAGLQPLQLSDADRKAAAQAISALRTLRSAIRGPLTYEEYGIRLANARVVVESVLERLSARPMFDAIEEALGYYQEAFVAWRFNERGAPQLAAKVLSSFRGCKHVDELPGEVPDAKLAGDRAVSALFACAADGLARAQALSGATCGGAACGVGND
jgi:hypothetical protein